MTQDFLEFRGISKAYGGTRALDDVSFAVPAGHVRALLGENGAGKSTLIRVLAGTVAADAGTIVCGGREGRFATPLAALEAGVVTIYQEFNLVPQLTVAENMFLGWLPTHAGWIDRAALRRRAAAILERIGAAFSPDDRVGELNVAGQQMVEIAKALSRDVKVLLMDEPTAALNDAEIEVLFRLIRSLRADGVCILYVSHRMAEIFAIADSVTVLKDGRHVGTRAIPEVAPDDLVRMMIGRPLGEFYPARDGTFGAPVLSVRDLSVGTAVRVERLEVRAGEVVGIAGLEGQGQRELVQALAGAVPLRAAELAVAGRPVRIRSPREAIAAGIGYVPDDRKRDGLALIRGCGENLAIASLGRRLRAGLMVAGRAEARFVAELVAALRIKLAHAGQKAADLSGGNQQKLVLGKVLGTEPKVLVLAEPTRGVDVGAKREIYDIIRRLTRSGVGVILLSGELPEVIGMSDRVLVMAHGRIVAEMSGDAVSEEAIMRAATAAVPEAGRMDSAA